MNYQKLFDYMSKVYGLNLLESEMQEMVSVVNNIEEPNHVVIEAKTLYIEGSPIKGENAELTRQSIVEEIIQWAYDNYFNVEDQAGVKYLALDFEEMKQHFSKWLEMEKTKSIEPVSCTHACSPSDYYKGGKCDKMGCYKD